MNENAEICFRKGTLIKCAEGWKEIEALRVGEPVWTHRGRLRAVIGVQRRPHVGRLVGLCLQGDGRRVWCTPEQHFLAALTPSPQAERGKGGEDGGVLFPTPSPSPLAGRGKTTAKLGGSKSGLATLRRSLRNQSTPAEVFLWERIRGRRLCGAKFRRQHSLGAHYIVDFYCAESKLAIELDGSVHDSAYARWSDGIRHRQLQDAGVRVLRFRNERIISDIENVLREIGSCLATSATTGMSPEDWRKSEELACNDNLIANEQGEISSIASIENIFVSETLYDLIVQDDSSFVTTAGVVQNSFIRGG